MESYYCLDRAPSSESDVCRKYDSIPLSLSNEVSVGRGNDVTIQIASKEDPLMLSRKHAIFKYLDNISQWTVVDNKSLNGVFVNLKRILPLKPHIIKEGDEIHLGMPSKANISSDFIFKFTKKQFTIEEFQRISSLLRKTKLKSELRKVKRKHEVIEIDEGHSKDFSNAVEDFPSTSRNNEAVKKARWETGRETKKLEDEKEAAELKAKKAEERLKEVTEMLLKEKESVKVQFEEEMQLKENKLQEELQAERERRELEKKLIEEQMKEKFDVQMKEKENYHLERLKTQHEELLNEKNRIQSGLEKEMEAKLSEKERSIVQLEKNMQERLEKEIQDKEREMMEELKHQKEELLKEKENVEQDLHKKWRRKLEEKDHSLQTAQEEMRKNLEGKIKEKEEMMLLQLTTQKEQLLTEKKKVEDRLQQEMTRKLNEKNKDLQDKLEKQKQQLEDVIGKKHDEYQSLQTELQKSRQDKESQELNFEKAKQEAMEKVSDVMESELQCSICSELFIQAVTLNCSHSFCYACIMEWFKKKKECPCCRAAVTTYNRSIVLDNYIDSMVGNFSEELKTRRVEVVKERKSRNNKAFVAPSGVFQPPIVISDDEDEEDDSEEDEYGDNGELLVPDCYGILSRYDYCHGCDHYGHNRRDCPT